MRSRVAQYLNEIVSLTVMALMCLALISAQAGAAHRAALAPPVAAEPALIRGAVEVPALNVEVDFSFRHTGE